MPLSPEDVGTELAELTFEWTERDVILYALGVGAGVDDLPFVYEGAADFNALPTFAVIPAFPVVGDSMGRALDFDHAMTLHGKHRIELHQPIATAGRVVTTGRVTEVWDKGANAVLVSRGDSVAPDGSLAFTNEFTAFVRGAGGFGGERGPSATAEPLPEREPDRVLELPTTRDQALLYRQSGDLTPLHADPEVARAAGFPAPILHGLCTFGIVGRALVSTYCDEDGARLRNYEARFGGVVYPGETIVARVWARGDGIVIEARTKERGDVVLDQASAEFA